MMMMMAEVKVKSKLVSINRIVFLLPPLYHSPSLSQVIPQDRCDLFVMFSKKKVHSSGAKTFKHNVSFYWGEKAWLFIDYLQIFGALW